MENGDRRALIVHASRFGQSTRIAQTMRQELAKRGVESDFENLTSITAPDPSRHNAFVMVTSVRYGHFDKNSARIVADNRAWMDSVPTLLVTVSLTARTPAKRDPAVHLYTKKFLEATSWTPTQIEVMPGLLDYPSYNPLDRFMIRLIMRITGGETDPKAVIEYTDWDEVRAAANRFADKVLGPQD